MVIRKYFCIIDESSGIKIVPFLSIDYLYYEIYVQITEDRKKRVIDLYFNQHKTYAEIAVIEHISPRDIHTIIKEEEARRQKYKDQQQQEEISSKAYKLFFDGKTTLEVAIALYLRAPEIINMYREYLFNISNSSTISRSSIMSLSILKRLALLECI
jgi:predicted DNA-binding protein YlxM (UPF0122 family)